LSKLPGIRTWSVMQKFKEWTNLEYL